MSLARGLWRLIIGTAAVTGSLPSPVLPPRRAENSSGSSRARVTWNGCACKDGWQDTDEDGLKLVCDGYCCNPDSDLWGEWCKVADASCEQSAVGYCQAAGLDRGSCIDDPPGWADSEEESCHEYASLRYCNVTGGYGTGWDTQWGTFQNFTSRGHTALTACCVCGGGTATNSTSKNGSLPVLDTSICSDTKLWADADGDSCQVYSSSLWCNMTGAMGPGWHKEWGTFQDFRSSSGLAATVACCACGGGIRGSGSPAPTPAFRTTWNGCACKSAWTESNSSCNSYCCNPDSDPYREWCHVADEKCEESDWGYCRPAGAHSSTCNNDPPAWVDSEGDSCQVYIDEEYCTSSGGFGIGWQQEWGSFDDFKKHGKIAAQVCCGCGGGDGSDSLSVAATETSDCMDSPLWADSDGDTCDTYAENLWCDSTGNSSNGWHKEWGTFQNFSVSGMDAGAACCRCGGGGPHNLSSTNGMWAVAGGPCNINTTTGCAMSPNYPSNYSISHRCIIKVNTLKAKPLHVVTFETELDYDLLKVNGAYYSGSFGPEGVVPSAPITWSSDQDTTATGWKLCPQGERDSMTSTSASPNLNSPRLGVPRPEPQPGNRQGVQPPRQEPRLGVPRYEHAQVESQHGGRADPEQLLRGIAQQGQVRSAEGDPGDKSAAAWQNSRPEVANVGTGSGGLTMGIMGFCLFACLVPGVCCFRRSDSKPLTFSDFDMGFEMGPTRIGNYQAID